MLAAFAGGCSPGDGPAGAAPADRSAPDFTLPLSGGGSVALADFAGKTVVLDFWATWCTPCVAQIPELNAVFDAHRAEADFAMLGISVDVDGDDVVAPWLAEHGVRYPVALADGDLSADYGAIGLPATIILGPDGQIFDRHVGPLPRDEIEKRIAAARGG